MKLQDELELLKKAEKNNDELIELSKEIMSIAKERNDESFFEQVSKDIEFLIKLKKKLETERNKLQKELLG